MIKREKVKPDMERWCWKHRVIEHSSRAPGKNINRVLTTRIILGFMPQSWETDRCADLSSKSNSDSSYLTAATVNAFRANVGYPLITGACQLHKWNEVVICENWMKIWQNIIRYVATYIPQLNIIVVSRKCLTLLCTKFCPVYYGIMGVFTLGHFMHVHCYLTAYTLHSHFTT